MIAEKIRLHANKTDEVAFEYRRSFSVAEIVTFVSQFFFFQRSRSALSVADSCSSFRVAPIPFGLVKMKMNFS